MTVANLARPEIAALRPYEAAARQQLTVRLNANEVPWETGADPGEALNRYPPVRPWQLRDRLAELYGVSRQQLLVSRGSSEAIDLLIRVFCRPGLDNIVITPPTFGMYRVYSEIQGAEVRTVPLEPELDFAFSIPQLLQAADDASKLLFVCSPNNPTGNSLASSDLETLLSKRSGRSLLVVDEAYIEFSGSSSAVSLLDRFDNLAILRTLSKAYGLAALRIGCVIAQPAVIGLLDSVLAPYALAAPIADRAFLALSPAELQNASTRILDLTAERQRMQQRLSRCAVVAKVWPSDANFLLVRFHDFTAVRSRLERERILVRDLTEQPGLRNCARITLGSPDENELLLRVLAGAGAIHE